MRRHAQPLGLVAVGQQGLECPAEADQVAWVLQQQPAVAVVDLVLDAPTRLARTGRAFHIASATVSPNPSARLFCTITSARRWMALTMAAFSSRSSMGRQARWTRSRAARGSAAPARRTCWKIGSVLGWSLNH